ncbi:hypothetical protein MJM83_31850, partial [Salmonella enterica subsp. enterica serovar Montevideo]|nr:hypothetical protein [Salmonella enterica subsp. enterica serovar Montevideo]
MRYTPPGKTITLRIKEADDQIHIIVENPGTPIAPEHLPRLFDLEKMGWTLYTLELLRQIPGLELTVLDSQCCGIAGTYGFKKEN